MKNINKIVRFEAPRPTAKAGELRERLKAILSRELDRLPEMLEGLEPRDRIAALLRLMPFIFPKVDSVRMDRGESDSWHN